ncbi:MAG TPA: copper resistance protein CopC [Candidatus Limnocylindrales bacterium]|jgi:hypothetical protein
MLNRRLGLLFMAGLLAVFAGLGRSVALAHAELDSVTPADKSTVLGTPAEIVMTFTEKLDPNKSSIKLVDPAGTVVVQGSTVDAGTPPTMRLALPTVFAPGTYTIRWISVSAEDGDLDQGTTTFTIAAAVSAEPSAAPSAGPSAAASGQPISVAPSPAASASPTTPAASTGDTVVPIVVALILLAALAAWLLRGRGRTAR